MRFSLASLLFIYIFLGGHIGSVRLDASLISFSKSPFDNEYVNAWVLDMNGRQGIGPRGCVVLQAITKKIVFTLCPEIKELISFQIGYITHIATACTQKIIDPTSCDDTKPYRFFSKSKGNIKGKEYELKDIFFLKDPTSLKVAHGPGDREAPYKNGLMVHGTLVSPEDFYLWLSLKNKSDIKKINHIKHGDQIHVIFHKEKPNEVEINGIMMRIVMMSLQSP